MLSKTKNGRIPAFLFYGLLQLWPCIAFSQQVDTAWVRRYNGPANGDDKAVAIAVDSSGNVYVTGSSFDSTTGYDYCTIKYFPNGETAWVRRYNGSSNWHDFTSALELDSNGNIYVTGRSNGDYATIKYDSVGQQLWARRLSLLWNDSNDGAYALAIDRHGNIYVTGRILDNELLLSWVTIKYDSQGNERWILFDTHIPSGTTFAITIDDSENVYVMNSIGCIKYDSLGNPLWFRSYPGVARDIALDKGGSLYVVGDSGSFFGANNFAVIKYDSSGNQLWVRGSNGIPNFSEYSAPLIVTDKHNNAYVSGVSFYVFDILNWLGVKFDSTGNWLWGWEYNGIDRGLPREPKAMALDSSGNVYVTGYDAWYAATIKYDSQGNLLWEKKYGDNIYRAIANDVAIDHIGNVFVTGFTQGDFFTIKYSPLPQLKGDLNLDGVLSLQDVIFAINYTFMGEIPPAAPSACDLNCDGILSGADVVILLRMVFSSAPAPC